MLEKQSAGKSNESGVAEDANYSVSAGRAGAMVMKSVSIFLASGRKSSQGSRRQQSTSSSSNKVEDSVISLPKRPRKKMQEDPNLKTAAQHAKIIETLKKSTKFSK